MISTFNKIFNTLIVIFIGSIMIWFLASVLTKQGVDLTNSTELEIHFKEIIKAKIQGKVSYYYDLHNLDNYEVYRIAANDVGCFDMDRFMQNVERGSLIKVYINDNGFTEPSVIGIVSDGQNYIDTSCINKKIEDDKLYIPMISMFIFVILFGILWITYYPIKRKSEKT
jgi:hypothetical protein